MISSPALEYIEGLPFRLIEELNYCESTQKVRGRFSGVVLRVIKDEKFSSFVVSDGSATAEVTLIYKKIKTQGLLPVKGDSVHFIGRGYKKVLGIKNCFSFLKILVLSIKSISLEQQFEYNVIAAKTKKARMVQVQKVEVIQKIKPLFTSKTLQSPSQQQELRTLIMIYCYYIFECNNDIQSYIFNSEMIRCSKDGREFMMAYGLTKDCLETVIKRTLQDMCTIGLLSEKMMVENSSKQQFFVIKRDLFRIIEKNFEQKIIEMGNKGGIGIEELFIYSNKKISQYIRSNYQLFNWKFAQKVLAKLQGINKIYKTSDKIIFPNIRT